MTDSAKIGFMISLTFVLGLMTAVLVVGVVSLVMWITGAY